MTKKLSIVILVICFLMIGCKKNREAFLEEHITVADEIVRIVDSKPTSEGIEDAKVYLDSKKSSLKSKFDAGKNDGKDAEMEQKFAVILAGNIGKIQKLSEKHPNIKNEVTALTEDFGEFLLKQ